MEQYRIDIGARLKQQRQKKGFTQEKLSDMLEISQKHYSEVERGIAGLSVKHLIALSDILEISLDYLLKGKECVTASGQPQSMGCLGDIICSATPYTRQQIVQLATIAKNIEQYAMLQKKEL